MIAPRPLTIADIFDRTVTILVRRWRVVVAFTVIDATHHTEDWTYLLPGDKPMKAHFDLTRAVDVAAAGGR